MDVVENEANSEQGVAPWVWAVVGASVAALGIIFIVGGIWHVKRQRQQRSETMFEVVVANESMDVQPQQTPVAF